MAEHLETHRQQIAAVVSGLAMYGDGGVEVLYEYPGKAETKAKIQAEAKALTAAGYRTEIKRGKILVPLTNVGTATEARFTA